jgi:rare lipoprotein A
MGEPSERSGLERVARACAPVILLLVLVNCSNGNRVRNLNYSPKVVADGDPIPKGGGSYKIGNAYVVNGRTYQPEHNPNYRAEGIASWYGRDFHGRRTANGEVYDMNGISAAHPTLPMPSYARVTNLENGRSMIVRVNDRGPYTRGRVIDLSIGAARALGTYGGGLARVRVEYVGRAGLGGSDDHALLASLRNGSPAPAPTGSTRLASGRPQSPLRTTPAAPVPTPRLGRTPAPPDYATVISEPTASPAERAGALGLMSGRGLY